MRKKYSTDVVIYSVCLLCIMVFCGVVVSADSDTIISIDPVHQIISPGDYFSFDVLCTPGVPVKSFELKLSYDPSIVQMNVVSEGTLFDGYQNFPNLGTIDNIGGRIRDVFDLILGLGNVSTEGTCISVNGVALSSAGNAAIQLYDVGVTNETGYLPIIIINGSVLVQHNIVLSDPSPVDDAMDVGKNRGSVSLSIYHKRGGLFNYSILTSPNIGSISAVNQSNGTKTCGITGLTYDTSYSWMVSVQEIDSGNWTNQTFVFTIESDPDDNGGSSGGGGDPFPPPPVDEPMLNNPPSKPLQVSGPLFIEPGVNYVFETSSFDVDDDLIRYRFDWGDGTLSNWSVFGDSNESVSLVHQWNSISNFTISVVAQDEAGLNSSWSDGLTVICKALDEGDLGPSPYANFTVPEILFDNSSILFNASFSSDHDIVLYEWDFGDGTTATGINPEHSYSEPGVYEVTLVVTDSMGNSFSKTMMITVAAQASQSPMSSVGQGWNMTPIVISGIGVILAGIVGWLVVKKRDMVFPWINRKREKPSGRHLFDDMSLSDTFVDGIGKIKDLTGFLTKSDQPMVKRPMGLNQKDDSELVDGSDGLVIASVPQKGSDDAFAQDLSEGEKVDGNVKDYFGRYSYDEVKEHLNRILKHKQHDEEENE